MNEKPTRKHTPEGEEPQAKQAGTVSDDVLDAVSGGGGFNPDGSINELNVSFSG